MGTMKSKPSRRDTGKQNRSLAGNTERGVRSHLSNHNAAPVSHVELSFDEMVIEGSRRLRDAIYRIHPSIFAPA